MSFFKEYIKKYWKPFSIAVIFLALETFCDLMQPTIMSKIVDIGVSSKDMDYVLRNGGLMLIITALGAIAASVRNILSNRVSQRFGTDLRLDIFKKINKFSFDNIDKFDRASLVTRLTNDVNQVQIFVNGLMRIFVKAPLLCIGSIIMAIRLNPPMSVIVIAVVPIVSIIILMNMKIGYPLFIKVQKALDKVNGVMREYLAGVRVVKAFNNFNYEMNRFDKSNTDLTDISINAMRIMAIFNPCIIFIVNIGVVLILWIGGIRVENGQMQLGQIIAFTNYMTQILFSLMMISHVFTVFVRARASAERIEEIFNEKNTMIVKNQYVENKNLKGTVEFDNVCFSYGDSEDAVLKNITFSCTSGETLGIIGSTGSGKTTLINLIPRFYDVSSGNVKINGVNVKDIDIKKLREKIGIVPQRSLLFTGTIVDNIRWGKSDATLEEIKNAAAVAEADDFISSLPNGYNTMIGQGGVNFSGGQKQRISIARALIRKPEILILDDSTSALDTNTESKIRESLKKYSKNLTCIIIAQRITSIMNADRIIVLDNGEIVGMGEHDELIKSCEVYQEIFYSQVGKGVI